MILTYLGLIYRYAFLDWHLRTDVWYAAATVLVTGWYGLGGTPMSDAPLQDLAIYVVAALVMFTILKAVILVPYRIWRDEKLKGNGLSEKLASEPQKIKDAMLSHRINLRKELCQIVSDHAVLFLGGKGMNCEEQLKKCENIVIQLKSDRGLQKAYSRYKSACSDPNASEHYYHSSLNLLMREVNRDSIN
ncbi:hypothetical protein [Pseudooctadecabacter sp.]|uniref:hypothetical protein n=1 Tax=Pseudooctadecabacter sp. TaxID=1966338 RepID=UPI0025E720D9|nr:hypothetical protein [Pseudooctadecabacter sp.]